MEGEERRLVRLDRNTVNPTEQMASEMFASRKPGLYLGRLWNLSLPRRDRFGELYRKLYNTRKPIYTTLYYAQTPRQSRVLRFSKMHSFTVCRDHLMFRRAQKNL